MYWNNLLSFSDNATLIKLLFLYLCIKSFSTVIIICEQHKASSNAPYTIHVYTVTRDMQSRLTYTEHVILQDPCMPYWTTAMAITILLCSITLLCIVQNASTDVKISSCVI